MATNGGSPASDDSASPPVPADVPNERHADQLPTRNRPPPRPPVEQPQVETVNEEEALEDEGTSPGNTDGIASNVFRTPAGRGAARENEEDAGFEDSPENRMLRSLVWKVQDGEGVKCWHGLGAGASYAYACQPTRPDTPVVSGGAAGQRDDGVSNGAPHGFTMALHTHVFRAKSRRQKERFCLAAKPKNRGHKNAWRKRGTCISEAPTNVATTSPLPSNTRGQQHRDLAAVWACRCQLASSQKEHKNEHEKIRQRRKKKELCSPCASCNPPDE